MNRLLESYIKEARESILCEVKLKPSVAASSVLKSEFLTKVKNNPINRKMKDLLTKYGYTVDEFWLEWLPDHVGRTARLHGIINFPDGVTPANKGWSGKGPFPRIALNPEGWVSPGSALRSKPKFIAQAGNKAVAKEDIAIARGIVKELNKMKLGELEAFEGSELTGPGKGGLTNW